MARTVFAPFSFAPVSGEMGICSTGTSSSEYIWTAWALSSEDAAVSSAAAAASALSSTEEDAYAAPGPAPAAGAAPRLLPMGAGISVASCSFCSSSFTSEADAVEGAPAGIPPAVVAVSMAVAWLFT